VVTQPPNSQGNDFRGGVTQGTVSSSVGQGLAKDEKVTGDNVERQAEAMRQNNNNTKHGRDISSDNSRHVLSAYHPLGGSSQCSRS
jgi:hypothetical protein